MKHIILVLISFLIGSTLAQKDNCHPRKLRKSTDKWIKNLDLQETALAKNSTLDSFLLQLINKNQSIPAVNLKPLKKYLLSQNCRAFQTQQLEEIYLEYTFYKIRRKDSCMSALLQPVLDKYKETIERLKANSFADSIDGVYIPKDLNDCFLQLNGFWSDSVIQDIKLSEENDFVAESHFGIGLWIRNNWGLWGSSRLSSYFIQLKIYHPDDMSGIILTSYHRFLNGKDIKLEEQIVFYHEYWKKNR